MITALLKMYCIFYYLSTDVDKVLNPPFFHGLISLDKIQQCSLLLCLKQDGSKWNAWFGQHTKWDVVTPVPLDCRRNKKYWMISLGVANLTVCKVNLLLKSISFWDFFFLGGILLKNNMFPQSSVNVNSVMFAYIASRISV